MVPEVPNRKAVIGWLTFRRSLPQFALLVLVLTLTASPVLAKTHPVPLEKNVDAAKCLECHLSNSDDAPSHDLPTIDLSPDNSMGHPYERHPVSGYTDPIRGGEMSCISCHVAHGSNMLHYLKMGSEVPEDALNRNSETKDMCHMCHLRLWGLEGSAKGKKKRN